MNSFRLAIHAVVDNPLANLYAARRLLAETRSLDEVKMSRTLGEAARPYARLARLGLEQLEMRQRFDVDAATLPLPDSSVALVADRGKQPFTVGLG